MSLSRENITLFVSLVLMGVTFLLIALFRFGTERDRPEDSGTVPLERSRPSRGSGATAARQDKGRDTHGQGAHFNQSRAFYAIIHDESQFPVNQLERLAKSYVENDRRDKLIALLYLTGDRELRASIQDDDLSVQELKALALTSPSAEEKLQWANTLLSRSPHNPTFQLIKASAELDAGDARSAVKLVEQLASGSQLELVDPSLADVSEEVWRDVGESPTSSVILSSTGGYSKRMSHVVNSIVSESSFYMAKHLENSPYKKANLAGNIIHILNQFDHAHRKAHSFSQVEQRLGAELQILENLPPEMDYNGAQTVSKRVESLISKRTDLRKLNQFIGSTLVTTDRELASAFAEAASEYGTIHAARDILGAPASLVEHWVQTNGGGDE